MEQLKVAIVVCSRRESNRVREKPFKHISGKPLLAHLLDRILPTNLPVIVAVPEGQIEAYQERALSHCEDPRPVTVLAAHGDCPLRRMCKAALDGGFDAVIRITHDKILVDPDLIVEALQEFHLYRAEYLYSSHLPAGSGFEIISTNLLKKAVALNPPPTEHISYAIRALGPKEINFKPRLWVFFQTPKPVRFLLDYDRDFQFFTSLFHLAGSIHITLQEAIKEVNHRLYLRKINRLPEVTIYTCVYNEQFHIKRCIDSVFSQTGLHYEYLIVNDASTDNTLEQILWHRRYRELGLIQNDRNLGLASSSNRVLDYAQGDYILRLDADDVFIFPDAVASLVEHARHEGSDLVYPTYVDQRSGTIADPASSHHVGGALFKKSAVNYVRFTDDLRGYEGYDFFKRAQEETSISYFKRKPVFFYTDRAGSLSAESPYRALIKKRLDAGFTGKALLR